MAENNELTYEDIMPGISWYRSIMVQKVPVGNGRFHREYKGYMVFKTSALGEVEVSKWTQIAVDVIKRNGDEILLDAIIDHVSQYCLWIKDEQERLTHAAKCLLLKSYETWAERGEFEIPIKNP